MATITVRFKAAALDIDPSTKQILGMHVEYDLTNANGTFARVWDGVPDAGTTDELWSLLRRFLRPMLGSAGVAPPVPPLPGSPS